MEISSLITDYFNTTATVMQENQTANPMGGVKRTYSTRISSLSCRITDKNISEVDEFGKWTTVRGSRLYCEASTANKAIEETDRITLDDRTFQVKAINNPGLLDRHLQIDILEVS